MRTLLAAAMVAAPLVALAQPSQPAPDAAAAPAPQTPQVAPPVAGQQAAPPQYAPPPPQYAPPPPPPQYAPPPPPPQYAPPPPQYAPAPQYAPPPPQYAPPPQYPQGYPPPPQYTPPAAPQPSPPPRLHQRDGWYIGFGFAGGDGNVQTAANTYSMKRFVGRYVDRSPTTVGLNFKIGATITPRLLGGFDLTALGSSADDAGATASVTIANYDLMATFFPWERGAFVRGGVGLSRLTLQVEDIPTATGRLTGTDSVRGTNVAAGIGYAWWLGRQFNLTANLDFSNQWWRGSDPGQPTRSDFWILGLGFDWY